jgi:hypothetical protein
VRHGQAGNIVKSSTLKELREGGKIRFKTIAGQLCYLLEDLLAQAGVTEMVFYSEVSNEVKEVETPVEPKLEVQEVPDNQLEQWAEKKEEPKEPTTEEVNAEVKRYMDSLKEEQPNEKQFNDNRGKKVFVDLFTYNSSLLPPDAVAPTFRMKSMGNFTASRYIQGDVVDFQTYLCQFRGEIFNKARLILRTVSKKTGELSYMVLQFRLDKWYTNVLSDMIADAILGSNDQTVSIKLLEDGDKIGFDVTNDNSIEEFRPSEAYIEKADENVLTAKIHKVRELIKSAGWFFDACPIENDKGRVIE